MKGKKLVIKSNALIEAKANLTLQEQKIILYAITKLDRSSNDFSIVKFNIKEFTDLIDSKGNRYNEFREIVRNLRKKEVILRTTADGKHLKKELITGWLTSIELAEGSGDIELEFSKKLVPYMLQLKESFTRYELRNVLYFKSTYSIRIYELLKQYETLKSRTFIINELRNILKIGDDEYTRFGNFEAKILKVSKEEINQYSDLEIDYEKVKSGRKVTAIKFSIRPRKTKPPMIQTETEEEKYSAETIMLRNTITELSEKEIEYLLSMATSAIIIEKYMISKQYEIKDLQAWMITAIKNDYQMPAQKSKENKSFAQNSKSNPMEDRFNKRRMEKQKNQ